MAELAAEQRPDLFSDWYNRFVKKPMLERPPSLTTGSATPGASVPTAEISSNPIAAVNPNVAPAATPSPDAPAPGVLSRFGEGLKNPATMALLGTGLSLMATPPRAVPYSNTELFGRAGLQGLNLYESALESSRKAKLAELTQEDRRTAIQDRGEYYRATAETRAMNAQTLADQRESKMRELEAAAQNKEEANKPVGPNPFGLPEDMTVGVATKMAPYYKPVPEKTPRLAQITIGGETKAYDLNNLPPDVQDALYSGEAKLPPGMAVTTDDQGNVHVIPKTPGITPKAGKPSAAKGGKPTNFDTELKKAEASLKEKGVEKPTTEQIAAERTRLFPKGTPKAGGRSPREELKGAGTKGADQTKVVNGKTYVKIGDNWYEK